LALLFLLTKKINITPPIAVKLFIMVKPATMKANGGGGQLKRAASCEKNDIDAESFYPLFNPKSKKMKEAMDSVVKKSAEMRKNGTICGDDQNTHALSATALLSSTSQSQTTVRMDHLHASNAMTSFVAIIWCAVAVNFHATFVVTGYAGGAVPMTKECSDVIVAASPRATRFSTGASPALHLFPTNITMICRFAKGSVAFED
jgi:hypothetical protein